MQQLLTENLLRPPGQLPPPAADTGPLTLAYARSGRVIDAWRRPADVVRGWGRLTVALAMLVITAMVLVTAARIIDESLGGLAEFLTAGLLPSIFLWNFRFTSPTPVPTVLAECLRAFWPALIATFALLGLGIALMLAGTAAGRGSKGACTLAVGLIVPFGPLHFFLGVLALGWMLFAFWEPVGIPSTGAILFLGTCALAVFAGLLLHWVHLLRDLFRLRRILQTH